MGRFVSEIGGRVKGEPPLDAVEAVVTARADQSPWPKGLAVAVDNGMAPVEEVENGPANRAPAVLALEKKPPVPDGPTGPHQVAGDSGGRREGKQLWRKLARPFAGQTPPVRSARYACRTPVPPCPTQVRQM